MTYRELFYKATRLIDKGEITLGEYDEMTKPLNREIEQQPSDTVSRGAFEQVMWERDVAIEQLKELGYGLGQKVEPCEDAVSRKAVDELSKELVHTTRDKADFLCNFWEGLQKLPPVTPTCEEREKGECPYYAG